MSNAGDERFTLRFNGISKRFGGIQALTEVSFTVRLGTCHALCGENGAGKSTLGKILAGYHVSDRGAISVAGETIHCTSPREALTYGIAMVHQELACCENLSVAENLCLHDLPHKGPIVDRERMRSRALELLDTVNARIEPERLAGTLSVGQLQLLQIASAIGRGARIVVFDEPTSSLSLGEVQTLFALIEKMKKCGTTCLYVSHRMDEIHRLCDSVTVLRDGQHIATRPLTAWTPDGLVQAVLGYEQPPSIPPLHWGGHGSTLEKGGLGGQQIDLAGRMLLS